MSVYKRGKFWYFEFVFDGQRVKESSKSTSKRMAEEAERNRRRHMVENRNGVHKRIMPKLFAVASQDWLLLKTATLAPRSLLIEKTNLKHILPVLGRILVAEISPEDLSAYQRRRLLDGASPKTINLEVGTIRAILRRNRVWANIQQDVRMLPVRDDVGQAISADEERKIKSECLKSRSRCLYPVVVLALNTGMRYGDVRLLQWKQVDFVNRTVRVGKSKTQYSSGRVLPLNAEAYAVLQQWASEFPNRKPDHYLFPAERYGASGDAFQACAYRTEPTKPIGSFKKAWEKAKKQAGVDCRFHDLRHTAATRMLEAGAPFAVLASIMGWSPGTTVRMVKRYGHIGAEAQRQAVQAISQPIKNETSVDSEHPPTTIRLT